MSHSTSTPRLVRLALCATAAGLLGTVAWLLSSQDAPLPVALAVRATVAAAPDGSAVLGNAGERASAEAALGWLDAPVGSRFRYRVTDRSDYTIKNPEVGAQPAGSLNIACFVQTTVLARRPGEALVEEQIEALQFLGADGRALTDDVIQASFQTAAAAPFRCRLDAHGAVLGYGFAAELDGDQRNFLRGILATLTFQAPQEQVTWTCDEADTTGEYEARYDVLPASGGETITVHRTRLQYRAIAGQQEVARHELRGVGEATFSSRIGWLQGTRIDEGMTMALPLLDLQTVVQRRAAAELVAADHVEVTVDAGDWLRANAPATGKDEQVGQFAAASERRHWEQLLRGVTVEQVLAELQVLIAKQPVDEEALNGAFLKLQWLVKLDDKAATAIGERLAMRELAGDLAGAALSSLGAAATPAAQAVLCSVRSDRTLDATIRQHATIATLQLATPSANLVEGLVRDAAADFDGRGNAMLVLGALARRSGQLADGRTPTQALLAMEADAEARSDLPTWLLAVGNAAPPETMAIVLRRLDHQDPAVRAAALVALRRLDTNDAVSVLIERGIGDPVASVRREAVLELGRREAAAGWAAITRVAQGDLDEELRNKASEMLRSRG
jgi:hypothetical protein